MNIRMHVSPFMIIAGSDLFPVRFSINDTKKHNPANSHRFLLSLFPFMAIPFYMFLIHANIV